MCLLVLHGVESVYVTEIYKCPISLKQLWFMVKNKSLKDFLVVLLSMLHNAERDPLRLLHRKRKL